MKTIDMSSKRIMLIKGFLLMSILGGVLVLGPSAEQATIEGKEVISVMKNLSRVVNVSVSGESEAYSFAVTVWSPDTGCQKYANWWEVVTPKGKLVYRRILMHSHVETQPFAREGGDVIISAEETVIVRVHMFPDGYSSLAMQGSVKEGFHETTLPRDFYSNLSKENPLPTHCAF